jgi:shikimate kinase
MEQISRRHIVVATGGGTFVDGQNRAAINADGVSVWLDVPLERLIDRVPADGRRPLASDRAGFERLYHQRRAAYEQAHVRLDAGRAGVDALVEQLVDWLET